MDLKEEDWKKFVAINPEPVQWIRDRIKDQIKAKSPEDPKA